MSQSTMLLPLSSPQEVIYFDHMLHPDLPHYNLGIRVTLNGDINPVVMEQVLAQLVAKHPCMRSVVLQKNEAVFQQVLPTLPIEFVVEDLRNDPQPQAVAEQRINAGIQRVFDVSERSYRALLLQTTDTEFTLLLVYHHLFGDGFSGSNILEAVLTLYNQLASGITPTVDANTAYVDFVREDVAYLQSTRFTRSAEYWQHKFSDIPEPLFQEFTPTPALTPNHVSHVPIARSLYKQLVAHSKTLGCSVAHLLITIISVYFARLQRRDEVVIGVPVHNRSKAKYKSVVGMFSSVLPLRVAVNTERSIAEIMLTIAANLQESYRHQRFPLAEINRICRLTASGRSQLFDVAVSVEEFTADFPFTAGSYDVKRVVNPFDHTPVSITVMDYRQTDDVLLEVSCHPSVFSEVQATQTAERLLYLLSQCANALPQELSLLTEPEQHQVLNTWNQTQLAVNAPLLVHQRVEEYAAMQPDAVAVLHQDQQVTYAQLNERSNRLARYLLTQGVEPDAFVAFCLPRSIDMIVTILGILKAGAAYMPIDINYPVERIDYMLQDAQPHLILTQRDLADKFSENVLNSIKKVDIDDNAFIASLTCFATHNISTEITLLTPQHLAYIIYTSGSTGKPKGVLIEHANLVNLTMAVQKVYASTAQDRFTQCASISFDMATEDVFVALCTGASLVLRDDDWFSDARTFWRYCAQYQVTITSLPTAFWHVLAADAEPIAASVRAVSMGGEAVNPERVKQWLAKSGHVPQLFNSYGPTETTVSATFEPVTTTAQLRSIGRPISNYTAYVLDDQRRLVPVGAEGELYIGGAGVARGYLHRPELTAAVFCENPFQAYGAIHSGRIYKTGDLVKQLPSGQIEYIARVDNQVKIRGFRIELGEIESQLSACDLVLDCAVIARDEPKRLVAYVVITAQQLADNATQQQFTQTLKTQLHSVLPDYMVPAAFVFLTELPLTPNGKIDRKALPAPDVTALQHTFVAASTPTELALVAMWRDILQLNTIGIHDNFFELGGHSLTATRLVSAVREALGVELMLRVIFERQTVQQLAIYIDEQRQVLATTVANAPKLAVISRDKPLTLSFAQQRLWLADQIEPGSTQYLMPGVFYCEGALDCTVLQRALQTIIDRHEVLRTVYRVSDNQSPEQVVNTEAQLAITQVDLTALTQAKQTAEVERLALQEAQTPFDLANDLLLRVTVIALAPTSQVLLITKHHIASDGWSVALLTRELATLYTAYLAKQPNPLPALALQYADYAHWQRQYLQGDRLTEQVNFWRERLQGIPTVHSLPLDKPRPAQQSFAGDSFCTLLTAEQQAGLQHLAAQQGATLFMVIQAAFAALMHRYSGENDIVMGASIANREQAAVEPLIGFFVNTLLVRSDFSAQPSFDALLAHTKQQLLSAYHYQQIPFEKLVDELQPERNLSHNPLFQVMLTLQNTEADCLDFAGLSLRFARNHRKVARVDLSLDILELGRDGIELTWEFATDLFERATIERMAEHFAHLIDSVLAQPQLPIAQCRMISAQEAEHILRAFNGPRVEYQGEATIHARFEARVAETPTAIAVVHDRSHEADGYLHTLSYAQLNQQANRVAHFLRAHGVKKGELVGIFAARSPQFLVTMLGIMKAGAAYVPLDPINPQARIDNMIATADIKVLFSEFSLKSRFTVAGDILWVDIHTFDTSLAHFSTENLPLSTTEAVTGDDLAYMIFTSGSTGTPKGALVHHAGALNHIDAEFDVLGFMPADKRRLQPKNFLQSAASSSDVSVWQFLAPVVSGGKTVILLDMADVENIVLQLQTHQVHLMQAAPVVLQLLVEHVQQLNATQRQLPALQWMMAIAEALPVPVLNAWLALYPDIPVMNGYGPSEASDDITEFVLDAPLPASTPSIPIGRPLPNLTMYVLNAQQQLQPIGVPGELCVSGVGVGPGYFNNPEKTNDVFIANPFAGEHGVHGDRLYRTGDLGRWLADGTLEFMGRIDNQVKIRGFRIELGEVEAAIAQVTGVADVAVLAVNNPQGQNMLVAYLTRKAEATALSASSEHHESNTQVTTEDVRSALKAKLPEYMLPAAFMWLDKMPLNAADKIDRRRLPAPDFSAERAAQYVAPRNNTESELATIWQALLSLDTVGIHDNFFEVGGHSLSATRLASAIRQQFSVEVAVRVVFEHQTIAELAEFIAAAGVSSVPTMVAVDHTQPQPLSFAQQRLWLIHQMDPDSAQYLIPYNLRLQGSLQVSALTQALNHIVQRHKILRTVYRTDANANVFQHICDAHFTDIPVRDLSALDAQAQQQAAQQLMDEAVSKGFDLANDIMLRAQFVKLADDDHLLLMTVHHIAFDGWSGGVLAREVSALYQYFLDTAEHSLSGHDGENAEQLCSELPLADLPFQYIDFAVWQRDWLQGDALSQQLQFWTDYLAGIPTVHNLPLDYPRPSVQHVDSGAYQHRLPKTLGAKLQTLAKTHDVTLFMLLNAAFSTLLHRYSGDKDIVVGSPIANREHAALEHLVGFFVNTLVLRSNFDDNPRFIDLLQRSKTDLLNAYQHQQIPFEKLVEALGVSRSLRHNPLVQVLLVLQNTDGNELALATDSAASIRISEAALEAKAISAGFDLTLDVRESDGEFTLLWGYATDLFATDSIARMALHFVRLLEGICAQPDLPVSQLTMITEEEAAHILADFNAPAVDYPGEATIHERMQARAAATPEATAVVLDTRHEPDGCLETLSYQQLNQLANQIAHFLIDNGVTRGELVAIYAQRTPRFLAAMLGIMKAGAAYVPVDPINPQERVSYMIANAEVRVLFTEQALHAQLHTASEATPACGTDRVWVDMQTLASDLADYSTENPQLAEPLSGDDLAYMIYTSGSTGMPKGALIHHAGALNHIDAECDLLGFMRDDNTSLLPMTFLQSAASSSDVSVWQFLAPVVSGGTTVILQDMADVDNVIRQLQRHNVHVMQAVPILLHVLVDYLRVAHPQGCPLPALKWIVSTGDALPVPVVNGWLALYPKVPIMNGYGPSEASDDVTEFVLDKPLPQSARNVPIGRPIPNLTMYVMNEQQQLQPIGVPGELCVSGVGVGKGYKNNPSKTADAFKPNPFAGLHGVHGDCLYRTGDLGRWLPDGTLEFMGRIDNQVKVRGFRIELGEVEAAIAQVDGVADVAVIVRKNAQDHNELAAYMTHEVYTPDDAHEDLNSDELRATLKTKLPSYMLPASFTWLAQMPLNPAGKIDRQRLPTPASSSFAVTSYVAPRTNTEQRLADIWQSLLSLDTVGIHDNFFTLGGHSLSATRLASAIREAFLVDVAVRAVFEYQTIAELAELINATAESALPALVAVDQSQPHPLSFAQQRLWLNHQLAPQSTQYLMPCCIRFEGLLDIHALTHALNAVLQRHAVLRTVYRTNEQAEVEQWIRAVEITHIPVVDVSHLPADAQHQAAQTALENAATQPFDLENDVMLRSLLVKVAEDEMLMLVVTHHIAFDGWSVGILTQEISHLYRAFTATQSAEATQPLLAPLARQYVDFAVWQRHWLQGDVLHEQLAFWQDYLHDVPTVHNLPLDKPRGADQSLAGAVYDAILPVALTESLQQLCQQQGVTLFMLLNAAFATLLHRYSGDADVVIGSPIANREHADVEPLIGFFVNTLVLRSNFEDNPRFSDLLQQSKRDLLNAYQHQQIPFEKLVEALDVPRNLNHSPLFQVMLTLHNNTPTALSLAAEQTDAHEVQVSDVPFDSGIINSEFDLSLDVKEELLAGNQTQLCLSWSYASALFEAHSIQRMHEHFAQLLQSIVADVTQPCAALNMLQESEKQQLISAWNDTQTAFETSLCIHERVEYFAATTPSALALTFNDSAMNYAQLNERANQLAHHLVALGVRPSQVTGFGQTLAQDDTSLVAICVERSLDMIVAMLAIWKAGGAYVPIDPDYPAERIAHIMHDSAASVLLTQSELVASLPIATDTEVVRLDEPTAWAEYATENIRVASLGLTSQHLAYMIYTSGSTGLPKGSLLHHRGLVNLAHTQQQRFAIDGNSRVLQLAAVAFDATTWEVVMALANGASLHLLAQSIAKDPQSIGAVVRRQQVTHATVTPALMPYLQQDDWSSCEHFCVAAETCPPQLVDAWSQGRHFYNCYGPSEATVCSTMAIHTSELAPLPIGLPIQNTQAYVFNSAMQLVPTGVVGELYVSGVHLSYGYLNRPELNAKAFIPHPYSEDPTAKLYRTGDLVRRQADGRLVYVGRADQQVKIRGVRIELTEIEAALLRLDWVAEAVVVARDTPKRLIAYVVPQQDADLTSEALQARIRQALSHALPDYMQPAVIMVLARIPLTRHGKVDHRALPEPEQTPAPSQGYAAPTKRLQQQLCGLWQKVLNVSAVGIDDNFFALGGHSLLATQLIILVRQQLNVVVAVRDVFEHQTIRQFAQFIEQSSVQTNATTELTEQPIRKRASLDNGQSAVLPLSFSQKRLWLVEQLHPGSVQYNMPGSVTLEGELNIDALRRAFEQILVRHEVLRTTYAMDENGEPMQVVHDTAEMPFEVFDLRDLTESAAQTRIDTLTEQQAFMPFDLAHDVMMRAVVVRLPNAEQARFSVLFTMHHIASDGWSMNVLVKELNHFYQEALGELVNALPPLTVQYADYALWQQQHLQGEAFDEQLTFWKTTLDGIPAVHSLPLDFARPTTPSHQGFTVVQQLSQSVSEGLHQLAASHNVSLFMIMHSAFSALLHRYSGEDDIVIATAIANREQAEVEHLIGFFVNTLVLRADFTDQPSFAALIQQSSEHIFAAFEHQQVPFDAVVDALQPERNTSYHPLFQIILTLHNQADTDLALAGAAEYSDELRAQLSEGTTATGFIQVLPHTDVAKFDLSLDVTVSEQAIVVSWNVANDLFNPDTVVRMAAHFERLMQACIAQPDIAIAAHNMLSDDETAQLLHPQQPLDSKRLADYNAREDNGLSQRFEQQAAATPARIALVFGEQRISYAELNARANQLARQLRQQQHIGANTLIGLCVQRSAEMVVGILAILKAGGAYVPLDPSYPQERIDYIMQDAQLEVVLAQRAVTEPAQVLAGFTGNIVLVDGVLDAASQHPCHHASSLNIDAQEVPYRPEHLAYVIYTSGSTGKPKGVLQTHHNALRLFDVTQADFGFSADDTWCLFHSFAFDFSVWELWGALLYSGKLLIPSFAETRDTAQFVALCQREQLSVLNQTPSAFEGLTEFLVSTEQALPSVRVVVFGGEALAQHHVQQWQQQFTAQHTQLVNMYGITETTVHVTYYPLNGSETGAIPIGKPLADQRIVLLNEQLSLVPKGCVGEMYVGGEGLAPGYLQREALTAERFIHNPFTEVPSLGERLYKTGDLAKYNEAGELVFMGRCDDQVKIRGFRIELGEIEAKLNQCHLIDSSVVLNVPTKAGDNQLVAYLRPNDAAHTTSEWLTQAKQDLSHFIPSYMMPSVFVAIDTWPLTVNGKINKKALPAADSVQQQVQYVAPRSATERHLHEVWCDILKQEQVSIHANFYEIGGNSLLLVRMNVKIKQVLNVDIPLMQLAKLQTIAQLAAAIIEGIEEQGALVAITPTHQTADNILLCVPYAGADGLVFQKLADQLGEQFAVYSLQFPREFGEQTPDNTALYQYFNTHLSSAVESVKALLISPDAHHKNIHLWGHCAGSLPATWFAHLLAQEGIHISEFFVGGSLWEPVQTNTAALDALLQVDFKQQLNSLDDVAELLTFAGFDANNSLSEEEWQVILPKAQKDQLFSSWCLSQILYQEDGAKLGSRVHCVIAKDDPITADYAEQWQQWQAVGTECFLYELEAGGHYFIDNQHVRVAQWIREVCAVECAALSLS